MGVMAVTTAACCFGASAIMHLLSYCAKSEASYLDSAIRVRRIEELGELLGDNKSGLLVAVSGKVGSTSAFICNRSGVLGVHFTEKAELVFRTKIEAAAKKLEEEESKEEESKEMVHRHCHSFSTDDEWKEESEEMILSHKTVPWFLEDETGHVNVVGFVGHLKQYVFDEPVNELFQRVLNLKGVEIVSHTCSEDVLEIGTPLTFVAEAFRDNDGAPTIGQPYKSMHGCINIDLLVHKLESASEFYEEFVDNERFDYRHHTVVVFGTVGSTSTVESLETKRSDALGVFVEETVSILYKRKRKHYGGSTLEYESTLLNHKEVPWYLEDGTARVNVMDYKYAKGFNDILKMYLTIVPASEHFQRLLSLKEIMIPNSDSCKTCEKVLEIGTPLTIVGRVERDKDGTPMIEHVYQVFNGRIEIKETISNMESNSAYYENFSLYFTAMGLVLLALSVLQDD